MANGRVIETLPRKTRINFTDYVELTELVSAATIPPGTYVSGKIRIDYTDAEIYVEANGESKEAVVKDDMSRGIRSSPAESMAASIGFFPSVIWTMIDSDITMALSTSIPRAMMREAKDI